ncbi:MAG: PucR family transcriptional regulator [Lachnospiraceae bacterium]
MFQCKDLFTLSSLSKLKLLAGSNGLHKGIRWVYKAESLHLSQWVHGGELLIISKLVNSEPDFNLEKILQEAIGLNMSGALLLIGSEYIKCVPKSVLALCETKDFPLFAIPWNLPLVDFFEEIGHAIANSNLHQNNGSDLIFNIIFESQISPNLLKLQALEVDYPLEQAQRFFILHFTLPDLGRSADMDQSVSNNIREYLQQSFEEAGFRVLSSCYSTHVIGMFPYKDLTEIKPIFEKVRSYVVETYPKIDCNIGIGQSFEELTQIKQSYEQAAKCINYASKQGLHDEILEYNQLGLYQLFSSFKQVEVIEQFVHGQIGGILAYDRANHTQLAETLYTYLQNNCNLLHTADALYTHRNTIKYRLARIEEITQCKLEDASVRLNFHVALYLHKFIL